MADKIILSSRSEKSSLSRRSYRVTTNEGRSEWECAKDFYNRCARGTAEGVRGEVQKSGVRSQME
jgi:hypothetical protein